MNNKYCRKTLSQRHQYRTDRSRLNNMTKNVEKILYNLLNNGQKNCKELGSKYFYLEWTIF